jgi:hypothetical protein
VKVTICKVVADSGERQHVPSLKSIRFFTVHVH